MLNSVYNPIITFGMVTWKRHRTFKRMIDSVINQISPQWKLVIYNDGPDLIKKEMIDYYEDDRIIFIETEKKSSGNASEIRNNCFKDATTEYVAAIDDDDYLSPLYVSEIEKMKGEKIDLIIFPLANVWRSHRVENISQYQKTILDIIKKVDNKITEYEKFEIPFFVRNLNMKTKKVSGAQFIFKTKYLKEIGGWQGAEMDDREDINTLSQIISNRKPVVKSINKILYFAFQDGETISMYEDDPSLYYNKLFPHLWSYKFDKNYYNVVKNLIPQSFSRIVDVGCGNGSFIPILGDIKKYIGIDWCKKAISTAFNLSPNKAFICANLMNQKLYKDSDIILCLDVANHIDFDNFINNIVPRKCIIISSFTTYEQYNGSNVYKYDKSLFTNKYKNIIKKYVTVEGNYGVRDIYLIEKTF